MVGVLITGGAGYIGSHVCTALARDGYTPLLTIRSKSAGNAR
jgi:nucleoside-diphosphate-sugar epimerase